MVNLTIDNVPVSVKENTTIMEAAASINIDIPKLCFLKGLNEIAACRVCVVELKGKDKLITSCNNVCEEGMEIFTNSKKVIRDRIKTVELILSQHDNRCVICAKSGNCSLQKVANDLNILEIPFAVELEKQPWNKNFPLIRDSSKCIKCMRCIQVCDKMQTLSVWDLHGTGARTTVNVTGYKKIEEADCSLCGQCITHCPVGALSERDDTSKFWEAIADPEKTVVVQIAPAVRTAWGEVFGLKDKDATVGKIVDALKKMGADYVFDTSFSADLTIMEEANEFVHRYTNGLIGDRPMFTSCCPGWVRFIKSQYPRMTKSLSTAKSPQQMFGAVMKSYFAEKIGVKPENMVSVSIMPCVAKKGEREMEFFHGEYAGHDVDIALTTRELTRLIRAAHIDPKSLEDVVADRPMGDYSGAGVIFGTTGGVMEAALRTAYSVIKKENPPADAFKPVRSKAFQENDGTIEATFKIDDIELNIAVVSGLGNTRKLLNKIERGEAKYDFVEVMACPGGCVGGGGQPVKDGYELAFNRGKKLYFLDEKSEIRYSHENRDIIALYNEYFEKPLSHKSHALLHVHE
ncbi:iron hydrogenase small subunit [Lachnoanaerobaculum sp. Marseille-Q4761]|uniref:[FeFe] hydrogenase, group A n=1 Tax=Lachnoanaerobaculum sp. Marseille-Q4761 TaxID=2819511 RepID=UPI001AA0E298|nr:[FeFe] hydrogenase, group A [Lachnoanaerobaculum sp. Marseille-Q4761]MBO1870230.1 iron hydrogenase small subunit [Lachnoanaerobaculum sp. Marseille-Q4761]